MRLLEMSVQNFRGIAGNANTLSFGDDNIIFIVGKNNVGKSALLAAYEYLVTARQKAAVSDFHGFAASRPIEICATFRKEPGDEPTFTKKGFNKWVDPEGLIRFRKVWTEPGAEGKKETWDPKASTFVDNGFGGLEQHFQRQAPTPIRVPAMPSPGELSKWVNDTIKKAVLKQLRHEEAAVYDEVLEKVGALQDRILSKAAVTSLADRANRHFQKVFPTLTLGVNTVPGSEVDLVKLFEKEFSVTVSDPRFPAVAQAFECQGNGVVRQAMFNFLGLVRDEIPAVIERGSPRKEFLILFEEPEIYLHPNSIRLLRSALYELCEDTPFQILCASHSPQLIDLSRPHTSIARLSRDAVGVSTIYQAGDTLFASDEETRDRVLMLMRFDPNVCEVFFVDEAVLVEGDTEAVVLRELHARMAAGRDIFIVNTGSKNNIPFYQRVLTHFRIKHHVFHDSDRRYLYDRDGNILRTATGQPRRNSAWTLNERIWEGVATANLIEEGLSARYVFAGNFEEAHNYEHDPELGKPFSAFQFARGLAPERDMPVVRFMEELLGRVDRRSDFSPADVEQLVLEPVPAGV